MTAEEFAEQALVVHLSGAASINALSRFHEICAEYLASNPKSEQKTASVENASVEGADAPEEASTKKPRTRRRE